MPSRVKKTTRTLKKSVVKKSAAVSVSVNKSPRPKAVVPVNLPTVSALEPMIFGSRNEVAGENGAPRAIAVETAAAAPEAPVSAPRDYPNTSKIKLTSPNEKSIIKSVRAGFYLGVIVGMVMVSLLVAIAYFSLLSSAYASTGI